MKCILLLTTLLLLLCFTAQTQNDLSSPLWGIKHTRDVKWIWLYCLQCRSSESYFTVNPCGCTAPLQLCPTSLLQPTSRRRNMEILIPRAHVPPSSTQHSLHPVAAVTVPCGVAFRLLQSSLYMETYKWDKLIIFKHKCGAKQCRFIHNAYRSIHSIDWSDSIN